jgi:hypothetical protein
MDFGSVLFLFWAKKWKSSVMNLENLCSAFYARLCLEEPPHEAYPDC